MKKVYRLLEQWVDQKLIPSAVLCINYQDTLIVNHAFGSAHIDTIYDIASLTKVTATLPSILLLMQASKLALDDRLVTHIPTFPHRDITIRHCLQHMTGLPGSLPYPQDRYATKNVWDDIYAQPLISKPGSIVRYSDLGMIWLGKVIENISGQSLSAYAQKHIYTPLNMQDTAFLPQLPEMNGRIAPTEWDDVNKQYLQGAVHDEVSYRLGGVSGSAGLFSTAKDLSNYARAWLYPMDYALFTTDSINQCFKLPIEARGLGWQVQDFTVPLACGENWPKGSFGHTGFTGTSIWIEPHKKLSVVLLTNAVHYGRQNKIVELRRQLHELIYDEVLNSVLD